MKTRKSLYKTIADVYVEAVSAYSERLVNEEVAQSYLDDSDYYPNVIRECGLEEAKNHMVIQSSELLDSLAIQVFMFKYSYGFEIKMISDLLSTTPYQVIKALYEIRKTINFLLEEEENEIKREKV